MQIYVTASLMYYYKRIMHGITTVLNTLSSIVCMYVFQFNTYDIIKYFLDGLIH